MFLTFTFCLICEWITLIKNENVKTIALKHTYIESHVLRNKDLLYSKNSTHYTIKGMIKYDFPKP